MAAETPSDANTFPAWGTVVDAAAYTHVSPKTLYRAVDAGKLRAARVNGRRSLKFRRQWCDEWLESCATPVEVSPRG